MTSPRQRKKRFAILKMKEKLKQEAVVLEHKPNLVEKQVEQKKVETPKAVASPSPAVVESVVESKPKKIKIGSAETKTQDPVLEQAKEEVKTETKE
jgi:hypothetical protein